MNIENPKEKNYFTLKNINSVIRFLTISDILILSGFGLITPIFAVFIVDTIKGGNLEVAGIASTVYLLTRSLAQIPIANMIDKIKGERDDFWAMLIGSLVFSCVPLLYLLISTPGQLYFVQFIYGLAMAFAYPSWFAIFTRHIDREHEGIEWGTYHTLVDLGGAGTAALGGFLAYKFGFNLLFVLVSLVSFAGSFFLLGIYRKMRIGYVIYKK
ncbi:MAG: MFS transporter [Patescibacteria group bacterium]|nr:MFS transporter [Patescibacteria group bacterium]MDD5294322.1 MFS transporter [Patescibacteria group bacterium]MDD5554145.1 MFS transporter [Patescibacteria group bacterium]